ncbi:MAG: GAF domain-containing protein [Aggregatilineaceae bacterium]
MSPEASLAIVGDSLQEALIMAAADTLAIEYANAAAEVLSGFCREDLCRQTLISLVPSLTPDLLRPLTDTPDAPPLELVGDLLTREAELVRVCMRLSCVALEGRSVLVCLLRPLTRREGAAALLQAQRDLAVSLSAESDLDQALELVVHTAARLSAMDGGGIYLLDEKTGALHLHYHLGLPDEFVRAVSYLPADAPQTRLVRQGTPLYLDYHRLVERMGIPLDETRRQADIAAIAVVPLISAGDVIGSLNIFSRTTYFIPRAVRHTLEAVASQAANAIARIRAEQAWRVQEQIARSLLNATPDSAVLLDRNFVIQAINQAGTQLLGAPAKALIGKSLLDGVPPEIAALLTSHISQVFISGQPVDFIYDRCERILSVSVYPLSDASDEVEQVAMFGRDITEQHFNEMALRQQRTLLAAVAQATSHLLTDPDPHSAIEKALAELGEASVADWIYVFRFMTDDETGEQFSRLAYYWARKSTAHLFNWNNPALQRIPLQGREALVEYLRTGASIDSNIPLWREQAKTDSLLAVSPSPFLLPIFVQGELWGIIGFGHHNPAQTWGEEERHALRTLANALGGMLTRHQTMRRLQEERDFAETLRDMGMTITSTLDPDSVLDSILQQARRIIPYDTATIFLIEGDEVRMASRRTVDPQRFPKPIRAERVNISDYPLLQRLVGSGETVVVPDTHQHPQWRINPGTEYVRSWLGTPIVHRGQILGFLALHSAQPGTYQPKHANAIVPLAAQAGAALHSARLFASVQQLERTKSEMIRIASHDLRSPLARLIILVNRLLGRADLTADPSVERDLVRMRDSTMEMERLINDLLSLERIEARQHSRQMVDWCVLVRQVIEALQPEITGRGHQLVLKCPNELPALHGDPTRLYHAAYNLLHNAIKYTPAGGHIEVRVRQEHHGDQTTLVFEVEDNGTGIAPEQQPALFQPFFRANGLATNGVPGIGLGLTVVKAAVEYHQGQVYCESTPGQGSLFGFWVPLEH